MDKIPKEVKEKLVKTIEELNAMPVIETVSVPIRNNGTLEMLNDFKERFLLADETGVLVGGMLEIALCDGILKALMEMLKLENPMAGAQMEAVMELRDGQMLQAMADEMEKANPEKDKGYA